MHRYNIGNEVKYDAVDNEIVIYMPNGDLYVMDNVGSLIFEEILNGKNIEEIVCSIQLHFVDDSFRSESDVPAFITRLCSEGILTPASDGLAV